MDSRAGWSDHRCGSVLGYSIVYSRTDTLGWRATCPDFATVLGEGTTQNEAAGVASAAAIALIEMRLAIGVPVPVPRAGLSAATGLFLPAVLAVRIELHNQALAAGALAARWRHARATA